MRFLSFWALCFLIFTSSVVAKDLPAATADAVPSLGELSKVFIGDLGASSPQVGDTLQVRVLIPQPWHLTSHVPEDEFLIPLEAKIQAKDIQFGAPIYPKPTIQRLETLDINGSYFEDSLIVGFEILKLSEASWTQLKFKLYYQACTHSICLSPREESMTYGKAISGETSVNSITDPISTTAIEVNSPMKAESLWLMLILAFIGGIILNFMPCVLPVLGLKIFALIHQSEEHPRQLKFLGMSFTLGVLTSFFALSLVIIFMKKAGEVAGWGFQFTHPTFVMVMVLLIFGFALNLLGLYEITLSSKAMTEMDQVSRKNGIVGAFFNGAFMTLMSTPCSAPFLGPAMGYGLSQSSFVLILFFLSAGLGLALPFFLMTLFPKAVRFLPRPGNWMIILKEFMAFVLLFTGVWLLFVLSNQVGNLASFKFLGWLLLVAMLIWIWGKLVVPSELGQLKKWTLLLVFSGVAVLSYFYFVNDDMQNPPTLNHEEFSIKAVEKLNQQGQWVFVDYTADWCISCKVNEKTTLKSNLIEKYFALPELTFIIADYTRGSSDIDQELKRFSRAGIPLYVLYGPDGQTEVFPEVITPGMLADVFEANELSLKK